MTAYALQRRLPGKGVTVSALHPGLVSGGAWNGSIGITSVTMLPVKELACREELNMYAEHCSGNTH